MAARRVASLRVGESTSVYIDRAGAGAGIGIDIDTDTGTGTGTGTSVRITEAKLASNCDHERECVA